MKWINTKQQLPKSGNVVLVEMCYMVKTYIVCRYMENLTDRTGYYKNIFVILVHPKFPKEFFYNEKYMKISRIKPEKVKLWTLIE